MIYLNLYKNGKFDLYLEDLELDPEKFILMKGTWTQDEYYTTVSFNKYQPSCEPCNFRALFIDPDGNLYDENSIGIDDSTFKIKKSESFTMIYGVSCAKY